MGILYLTLELLRHPLWAIPFFLPYLWVSQMFASFPICCPKGEWHLTSGYFIATGPATICCKEKGKPEMWEGEESHMEAGGKRRKGTEASVVHWGRKGTCYCLSLQVMAVSRLQYLIRWGKRAIPNPWSYVQIAPCTTFLTALTYGQGTVWAQLCSRGHRGTGHPSVWLRSCFLLSPALYTAGLRRAKPAQRYSEITDWGSQPTHSLAYWFADLSAAQ